VHDIAVRRGIIIDRTPFSSPRGPARPLVQRQEADRSISGAHEDIVERLAPRAKRSRLRATPLQRSPVASIKPGADAAPSAQWAIRGTGGAIAPPALPGRDAMLPPGIDHSRRRREVADFRDNHGVPAPISLEWRRTPSAVVTCGVAIGLTKRRFAILRAPICRRLAAARGGRCVFCTATGKE
jgi:hypothetical protein